MKIFDMLRGNSKKQKAVSDQFRDARLDYAAVKPSKFRRIRTGLGGSADSHFRSDHEFWTLRENARDMDRNDAWVGQLVNRALDNIIGTGMTLDPKTGDHELDLELRRRWADWATNPRLCDATGRLDFYSLERLALRHIFIDGDVFTILLDDGAIQMVEGDRVTSIHNMSDNVVHGVELSPVGKPLAYYFLQQQRVADRKKHRHQTPSKQELRRLEAYDADNNPNVVHVFNPTRLTQTRGVTVFAPVFDLMGMAEDLNFANLIKAQVASCIALFILRDGDHRLGSRETETGSDNSTVETYEELQPGMIARLRAGEDIKGFSPNVPGSEFKDHMNHLLRTIGNSMGMPLELVTLDLSQTNFHGYRGAMQQARKSFECIQRWYPAKFHRPIYEFKVRQWSEELGSAARNNPNLMRHRWASNGWNYVDPVRDTSADRALLESGIDSPRGVASKRGRDWDDIVAETVADRKGAIVSAIRAANEINDNHEVNVHWRELLNWSLPAGMGPVVGKSLEIAEPEEVEPDETETEPIDESSTLDFKDYLADLLQVEATNLASAVNLHIHDKADFCDRMNQLLGVEDDDNE